MFPLSHLILYLKGAIHQAREEWEQAKSCYQNALSIYPCHLQSLQSLGLVQLQLGSPRVAEMTLRAAIRLDPKNHVSWYNLGQVMEVTTSIPQGVPKALSVTSFLWILSSSHFCCRQWRMKVRQQQIVLPHLRQWSQLVLFFHSTPFHLLLSRETTESSCSVDCKSCELRLLETFWFQLKFAIIRALYVLWVI